MLAIGITVGGLLTVAPPTEATCLRGNVVVHRDTAADMPLLTEGQCLVSRPSGDFTEVHSNQDAGDGNLHPGAPAGAKVDVWVPWVL